MSPDEIRAIAEEALAGKFDVKVCTPGQIAFGRVASVADDGFRFVPRGQRQVTRSFFFDALEALEIAGSK